MKSVLLSLVILGSQAAFSATLECRNKFSEDGLIQLSAKVVSEKSLRNVSLQFEEKSYTFPGAPLDIYYKPRGKNADNVRYMMMESVDLRSHFGLLVSKAGMKKKFEAILFADRYHYHGEPAYFRLSCELN